MEKLCECGCGLQAPIAPQSDTKRGWVKNEPVRFVQGHYLRSLPKEPLDSKFWARVDKDGPIPKHSPELGNCWLWTGILNPEEKRGFLKIGDRRKQAAHVSWFLHTGRWPALLMCHKCDNPTCVRFEHLFEGTQTDNMRDAASKNRRPFGTSSPSAKLNEEQVRAIRQEKAAGLSNSDLARKYLVHWTTIQKIIERQTWRRLL